MIKPKIWRGLTVVSSMFLAVSVTASMIMELYRDPLDDLLGTQSSTIVTEEYENADDAWNFKSEFQTAKDAFEGYRDYALKESKETFVLLKNSADALPIAKNANITMMGLRSYAPVYGNSGGSIADKYTVEQNYIYDVFAKYFKLNPSMLDTYKTYFSDKTWGGSGFGATPPEYAGYANANEIPELSPTELAQINPNWAKDNAEYDDAAIVVLGRPGGESKEYYLGAEGIKDGSVTDTGNILGISTEEKAIIDEAKKISDKVIVLINSTTTMEFKSLVEDPDIDAIMWIGYPGPYGLYGVCEGLMGEVSPSGHLGDTFVTNSAVNPAMQSSGKIPWANAADFSPDENVNSYLVQAEGIYAGYRYYETRYYDIVTNGERGGDDDAERASAGTYTGTDYKPATTDGTWDYEHEVIYPFGYGLSYTEFEQKLDSVSITGDKKTATVKVTVTNTGDKAGKSVVQLYAQTPYTDYDKTNGVEKSAIQLMDFEKTESLDPGTSQTITMYVDMANIASYDAKTAKTYIVDDGDYYFAIGDDSHDALNNILAAQGYGVDDGMTSEGDETKTYRWHWDFDDDTFSVSDTGVEITNKLTEGDYAMDLNAFMPGKVTYMTRSDWNGTFPDKYEGLSATGRLATLLGNDFIDIPQNEDTDEYVWGDTTSKLTINDLKGAEFDDERWEELINKATIDEFLAYAASSFHHIEKIDSVGLLSYDADDGPGGSDTHYLGEGTYQGKEWADAEDYAEYGTRVGQGQINLAYAWNKELAYENGEIILGETSLCLRLPIMIGPGMNIHRNGYNGRGGEYYSEDPILSGYIGSATIQGAQSKGCLVNIKHAAFNDSEINRSGIAVFMNEQKARELELRNLQQAFEGKGKPASFYGNEEYDEAYTEGALGVMSSYNRIGAVASSANRGVMVDIMRGEWGFKGYNVTDFTGVSLKAAPKESILAGTTNFCGFGNSVDYWTGDYFINSKEACKAVKDNLHYALYALANSNALNGINSSSRRIELMTSWRILYITLITVFSVTTVAGIAAYTVTLVLNKKKESN